MTNQDQENRPLPPGGAIPYCEHFTETDFDAFWDEPEAFPEIDEHCLTCNICRERLRQAGIRHEAALAAETGEATARHYKLALETMDRIDREKRRNNETLPLAAAPPPLKVQTGKAYGIAVNQDAGAVKLINCQATVSTELMRGKARVKVVGRYEEGFSDPYDIIENLILEILPQEEIFRRQNLDRRKSINVNCGFEVLCQVDSLTLAIIMALARAVYNMNGTGSTVYSGIVEADSHLAAIGMAEEKIMGAAQAGAKRMVMPAQNHSDELVQYAREQGIELLFAETIGEVFRIEGISTPPGKEDPGNISTVSNAEAVVGDLAGRHRAAPAFVRELLDELALRCRRQHEHQSFGTTIFIGSHEKIETFHFLAARPQGGRNPSFADLDSHFSELCELADGTALGLVFGLQGVFYGCARIDRHFDHHDEYSPLLTGTLHELAVLSAFSSSVIVHSPRQSGALYLFDCGRLIYRFINGTWERFAPDDWYEILQESSRQQGFDWDTVKKTAQAALILATTAEAGTLAILPPEVTSTPWLCPAEEILCPEDLSTDQYSAELLAAFARLPGAVILDTHGTILSSGAYFLPADQPGDIDNESLQSFGKKTGALIIRVSRYGKLNIILPDNKLTYQD